MKRWLKTCGLSLAIVASWGIAGGAIYGGIKILEWWQL